MNKSTVIAVVAVVSLLVFGAFNTYAEMETGSPSSSSRDMSNPSSSGRTSMADSGFGMYRLDKLIGSDLKTAQGESLGEIRDFVVDTQGRVAFALVGHGGFLGVGEKFVAVPFSALHFSGDDHRATVDFSKDQFANAPMFDKNTPMDRAWAENSYRHFGQTPYWSESGNFPSDRPHTMSTPEDQPGTGSRSSY